MKISTNISISPEVQKLLIKVAASQQVSVEALASEMINEALLEKLNSFKSEFDTQSKDRPALAGTEPFMFYGTPEESGLPAEEWDMEQI